jgi:protein-S-isoprenylcysteine O-methyltransferase Ste14
MRPAEWFIAVWILWAISWAAASRWSGPTRKRAATWDVWAYRVIIAGGVVLISHWTARALGLRRIWHVGYGGAYALLALTCAGILFAWWARIHLGNLWSGKVERKEEHRIVDTGPYALVRHPIYSGLIVAGLATTVAQATPTALVGWALVALGLWLKASIEERFLTAELDAQAYASYRRRVPMLVPFLTSGG